jgi:uncharacterized protein (DUF488 family)
MKLFTIGFTKKSAEVFFTRLREAGVKRIVDVRLHNVSQLAGFSKKDDLRYFAKAICNIDYIHIPDLAPTAAILDPYKKGRHADWDLYRQQFLELIRARKIERTLSPDLLNGGCLLCSEESPHHCHRRLVAEYLRHAWTDVEIEHIL